MLFLERANNPRRVGIWSLVGLLLIPLVVAGGFLLATWKSDTRLDLVQAAVVNLDEPIKIDGQTVPLGRQLAGGLVDGNEEDSNFSWLLTDAKDATAGLESGRYAAVVTIPKSFSANATSYSKNNADAEPATLGVTTSEVAGLSDPVVGQAITAAATKALNTQLTESYLKNIYLGFNDTGKQFKTVADAAGKLADGTTQLSDGIGQTADGTAEFADGLGQLDTGVTRFATGLGTYTTGVSTLSDGVGQYADGVGQYATGVGTFADGVDKLASGADQSAAGAAQLSDGITQAVKTFRYGTKERPGGTVAYAAGVDQFATGLKTYQREVGGLAADPDKLAATVPCPVEDPAACQLFYGGVQAGVGIGLSGFEKTKDDKGDVVPGLIPSAEQLATGAAGIDAGVKALGDPNPPKGQESLKTGADQLAGGLDQLATGTRKLAGGTDQLAVGADKLSAGADQLADGAGQLSAGGVELATGANGLADGVHASALGAEQLSAGVVKLDDGGEKLADGSTKLADGLAEGAKEIPSYNEATREKLSEVVTTPVTTPKVTSVFSDVSTTTLLAVLALWIGGLATYLVLRAMSARVLTSMKSSWRLALEALAPAAVIAAVQALVLTVMLQALLRLDALQLVELAGFALLTALAFAALNQALVAWFGGVGRFISVAAVVLAAAGSITSAVPELFDTVLPALPMTPALEGFRSIVADAGGAAGPSGLLLAWLLIGVGASIIAVARHRLAPATRLVVAPSV